jgi:hypothetical protein
MATQRMTASRILYLDGFKEPPSFEKYARKSRQEAASGDKQK